MALATAGRTADSVVEDVKYLISRHGESNSWYLKKGKPVFFVYDSYHIAPDDWRRAFNHLRGSGNDGFFIALWLNRDGGDQAVAGSFDGVYTYFATDGFSYGSSTQNWRGMALFSRENDLLFIPSVGPGYNDTKIRPWR